MILELFAGVGGCAEAASSVVAAIDHDEAAHRVYTANHPHPAHRKNLASVRPDFLAGFGADTWWMSPPCQPFTVRGKARDIDDPRCAALLHLMGTLEAVLPRALLLENVPGFAGSRAHAHVRAVLRRLDYTVVEGHACPSELGVPNERRRFYLVARRDRTPRWALTPVERRPLQAYLDATVDPWLYVPQERLDRFGDNLAVVDATNPDAVTHCFTSAYARSPVHAGSYLRDDRGIRHFSPDEIVRLLGFEGSLRWPDDVGRAKRYKLAGNSLSVVVVRQLLRIALED